MSDLDERALASIGGGLDPDEENEDDLDSSDVATNLLPLAGSVSVKPGEDSRTTEADRQTEKATLATLGNTQHAGFAKEMSLLGEMLDAANRARAQPDEKLKKLFEYIDQNMLVDGEGGRSARKGWTDHRIIVFTEYDDTIAYIRRHLDAHLQGIPTRPMRESPSTGARRRSTSGRRSRRPSTPTRPTTRSGSCWRPTRRARA